MDLFYSLHMFDASAKYFKLYLVFWLHNSDGISQAIFNL